MDVKAAAMITLVLVTLCVHTSYEKPIGLSQRCWCRYSEKVVHRGNIKQLKIRATPNCPLQVIATLRNNGKQVCVDPEVKWLKQYLEKMINK
ncbi:chemokine (C-X-C motif) ligand 12a (stromal cell-derived factor 1) isoform X2 [Latimeria chalumnae]|nr:PREDICTED: stromal cell-derived factor 1 isoform X2 [Latimeria chalumnae]AWT24669.1 SDF1 [Latimeria menadoensis]|eukprot:XP_014352198.1 PREDICTED: stromal cell-derived factor 1 isoform X2 [Latimeria chalumnae]